MCICGEKTSKECLNECTKLRNSLPLIGGGMAYDLEDIRNIAKRSGISTQEALDYFTKQKRNK